MSKQDDGVWRRMRGHRFREGLLRAVCGYYDYIRYNAPAVRKQTCRTSGRPPIDPCQPFGLGGPDPKSSRTCGGEPPSSIGHALTTAQNAQAAADL
jgi:hypothetical protein